MRLPNLRRPSSRSGSSGTSKPDTQGKEGDGMEFTGTFSPKRRTVRTFFAAQRQTRAQNPYSLVSHLTSHFFPPPPPPQQLTPHSLPTTATMHHLGQVVLAWISLVLLFSSLTTATPVHHDAALEPVSPLIANRHPKSPYGGISPSTSRATSLTSAPQPSSAANSAPPTVATLR
jgi:hypothetical protein